MAGKDIVTEICEVVGDIVGDEVIIVGEAEGDILGDEVVGLTDGSNV